MRLYPLFLQKIFFVLLFLGLKSAAQDKNEYQIRTIAFYNVENLFDTENDPVTFDDDRTPLGKDMWTPEKYQDKLSHIARVLKELGEDETGTAPAVIGICEIENLKVLEDLVNEPQLEKYNFQIIHYDSPDQRGVDVGLLFRKDIFKPLASQSRRLLIYELDNPQKRVYTRDQLVVSGLLDGEHIYFIVNHWPSRSGGEARSSYKRELAAKLNKRIIDSLQNLDPYAKIISMGDFNDDPSSKSIKKVLSTKSSSENLTLKELYDPMEKFFKEGKGTLAYRDSWNLFDQMILSQPLLNKDYGGYQFYKAGIFNKNFLITPSGQYKGYPFRSYGYSGYQGGYSDHFPVYVFLIRELKLK